MITNQDMAELKVQCLVEKWAPKRDKAGTVEKHSRQPSTELLEEPSEERREKSSKEPSEEPEHQLRAGPAPGLTSNRGERLDEDDIEIVAPQGDIHFSAKGNNDKGSQRLQEKQEEEEDKQDNEGEYVKEKEVQEDAQPTILTTRYDVQYEDQRPRLKESPDETPAEGFGSQKSQLDLQNQDYHPPLELLGEELLTSFVVVDSNSQDRISEAEEFPDCSPTSDHKNAPSPASTAPPLDECHNCTALEPETLASCESKDQTTWTVEPPESTPDHQALVSDIPKASSEAFDLPPAMAGIGGMKRKVEEEQEKEEVKVKAAPAEGEPRPEVFLSVQVPEVHCQEEELLLDSTDKEMELHPDSTLEEELHSDPTQEEGLHPNFVQEENLLPKAMQKEELPPKSTPVEVELILVSAQKEEELLLDSIQTVELLPVSTQEDKLSPNFIQKEEELLHDFAKEEEKLPPNSAQEEDPSSNLIKKEVQLLSNSTMEEELLSESAQKVQLPFDSTQKEVLLPDVNQGEKLPPNSAQEEEELEKLPLNSIEKEVKLLRTSTQDEKLPSEFAQEEEMPHDSTQKVGELPPDSAFLQKVQLHSNLTQKEELLPDSTQEEKLPSNSSQEEGLSSEFAQELRHDPSQKIEQLCDSTQEEEPSPESTQDDITPPVTTVSWWSSGGRDPAPGDWILIPEFMATANEDTFGHQVESEYQRLMDQFAAQVEASLKVAVEVIEREGGEEEEVEEKSRGAQGQEEEKVEKKDKEEKKGEEEEQIQKKKKAGEEEVEQERRRTEISIMEATMDANEWVTDSGQQLQPWLSISTKELAEESSAPCAGDGPAPRVAAIPPLMPQTVEVTFRLHYVTWSEQQTLAITGSRPELGSWAAFIPLEREVEGKEDGGECEGRGLWSIRVRLPAHSQLEWKFVVMDMGRVSRWEECSNRVLDTGDRDQLVHGWWGRE